MLSATITVAEITAPSGRGKMFKIADTNGGEWLVWPDKVGLYARGQTYQIGYESSNFNGKVYHTIKNHGGSTQSPQLPIGGYAGQRAAQPQRQATGQTKPAEDTRSKEIFVCGALNNALSNPNVNPLLLNQDELISMVEMFTRTWEATLGGKGRPTPQHQGQDVPFNDEIPDHIR